MTYDDIADHLFSGYLSTISVKQEALSTYRDYCKQAAARWEPHRHEIEVAANTLLKQVGIVIDTNFYEPCLKAGFFASLFSAGTGHLVTKVERTRTPVGSFRCRLGCTKTTGTCTRVSTDIQGDRYDNCMSVHAAQWLDVPDGYDPASLLWMEAGAVLLNGRYIVANCTNEPYRCSMCLKTMAGKGIVDLCMVGLDEHGSPALHFAPVVESLNTLIICNCADMLAENS